MNILIAIEQNCIWQYNLPEHALTLQYITVYVFEFMS